MDTIFCLLMCFVEFRIKKSVLATLKYEKVRPVQSATAQFVGIMIQQDSCSSDAKFIEQGLDLVLDMCQSNCTIVNKAGTSIFATLMELAPEKFIPHTERICKWFTVSAQLIVEMNENKATSVICHIL